MNYLSQLFQDLNEMTKYAPGADGVSSISDMQAAARSAHKRVVGIISDAVYNAIVDTIGDGQSECAAADSLRMAMANMTLCIQLSFDSINRRKNGTDVYKYELEGMRRSYMENYFNAMDALISAVTSISAPEEGAAEDPVAAAWKNTRYQRLISACHIKSADDFDVIYPIDGSCLFFFRTLPIQKEVIDSRLEPYFEKTVGNDHANSMLLLALAKKVVAIALRRFDILECPATIRNLFDDSSVSGQRKDERENATSLANMLDGEADSLISNIDSMLNADSSLDVSSMSAFNLPDDNIVMMP